MPTPHAISAAFSIFAWLLLPASPIFAQDTTASGESGQAIFVRLCAECHGDQGQGVADKHDEPLFGDEEIVDLAAIIDRTMPEDKPELCSPEESRKVAEYIHGAFYSQEARERLHPPKLELMRLTNRQFRESVADILGSFRPANPVGEGRGLHGKYFQSDGMNKKSRQAFERVDAALSFDFGEGSPGEGIPADQFSIQWNGSIFVRETGHYQFRVKTPNGARLYVNSDLLDGDRNDRDDSDGKREVALIDAWVSSGEAVREETGRIFLLGGRRYPMRLDYFKYKDKRGSIVLEWMPPHGAWSVVGAAETIPTQSGRIAIVSTAFPPDDGSFGYERGTAVSKEWHEATTKAAIEAATEVSDNVRRLTDVKGGDPNRAAKLKDFAANLAAKAFRRPLDDVTRTLYVERHFTEGLAPDIALKRAVISIFKSPRFLFPELGEAKDSYSVAGRLALTLWDSVPDAFLTEAAGRGELVTPEQVRVQAERMLQDPRARAKIADFFAHWLSLEEADEIAKDKVAYPDFNEAIVADLRKSLELFVEKIVWSETSDYRELLRADYLMLNERLAAFYKASGPKGEEFEAVAFDPKERAGVFTHPLLLSAFSYHKSSSPIHRGVFLTRNIMGRFLKPPPMAIEFMDDKFDPSLTMREKVTELTRKDSCMGCHGTINPLGFSLEHYDAVGRFRTTDNNKPVDAESDYTTPDGKVIKLRGPRDLADIAVTSDTARRGFVRQFFQILTKNAPAAYGEKVLREMDDFFAQSGCHMRKLVVEIATRTALQGLANPK